MFYSAERSAHLMRCYLWCRRLVHRHSHTDLSYDMS